MKLAINFAAALLVTFAFAFVTQGYSLQGYIAVGEFLRDKIGINIFYLDYGNSLIIFYLLCISVIFLAITFLRYKK